MRNIMKNKKLVAGLLVLGSVAVAGSAMAAQESASATVTVNQPLSLLKSADLNFGTFNESSTGDDAIFTLDASNAGNTKAVQSTGTDAYHAEDAVLGHFTLTGQDGQEVHVSATITDSVDEVDFNAVYLNSADSDSITETLGTGALNIYVGGQVTIKDGAADVTDGFTETVTVTANYN